MEVDPDEYLQKHPEVAQAMSPQTAKALLKIFNEMGFVTNFTNKSGCC